MHLGCLNIDEKVKPLFGGKFGECPLCLQPYNILLTDLDRKYVDSNLLMDSVLRYLKWMGEKEEYYLKTKFRTKDQIL